MCCRMLSSDPASDTQIISPIEDTRIVQHGCDRRAQQRTGASRRLICTSDAGLVMTVHGTIGPGRPVAVAFIRLNFRYSPPATVAHETLQAADKSGSVGAICFAARVFCARSDRSLFCDPMPRKDVSSESPYSRIMPLPNVARNCFRHGSVVQSCAIAASTCALILCFKNLYRGFVWTYSVFTERLQCIFRR